MKLLLLTEHQIFFITPQMETFEKIIKYHDVKALRDRLIEKGLSVVFTNGCFDILHYGHITYLQQAKKLSDILIVGVNADSSVRAIKGKDRPINKEKERCLLLSSLECVDFVVLFSEDTPYNLIDMIQPHVLVKGGDWAPNEIVGNDIVNASGGKVMSLPYVDGYSTTDLINRIVKTYT